MPQEAVIKRSSITFSFLLTFWHLFLTLLSLLRHFFAKLLLSDSFRGKMTLRDNYHNLACKFLSLTGLVELRVNSKSAVVASLGRPLKNSICSAPSADPRHEILHFFCSQLFS